MYVNNFIDLVISKSFHYKRQLFKREHIYIHAWLSLIVAIAPETLHCIVHSMCISYDYTLHFNSSLQIELYYIMYYKH